MDVKTKSEAKIMSMLVE